MRIVQRTTLSPFNASLLVSEEEFAVCNVFHYLICDSGLEIYATCLL